MARPMSGQLIGESDPVRGLARAAQVPDIRGLNTAIGWPFSGLPEPEHPMSDSDLFFSRTGMDPVRVQGLVDSALQSADDGELFLEYSQSESFAFDDNRLKAASFDTSQGFGLRAVAGEATGYAHATELSEDAIARAAQTVKAVSAGHSGQVAGAPARSNVKLYTDLDPLQTAQFGAKVSLLEQMNEYAHSKDS